MFIKLLTVDMFIPESRSLKQKRAVIKSLKDKLRQRFNISISEIDHNDLWQRTEFAILAVSNKEDKVFSVLQNSINLIENEHRIHILKYNIESL